MNNTDGKLVTAGIVDLQQLTFVDLAYLGDDTAWLQSKTTGRINDVDAKSRYVLFDFTGHQDSISHGIRRVIQRNGVSELEYQLELYKAKYLQHYYGEMLERDQKHLDFAKNAVAEVMSTCEPGSDKEEFIGQPLNARIDSLAKVMKIHRQDLDYANKTAEQFQGLLDVMQRGNSSRTENGIHHESIEIIPANENLLGGAPWIKPQKNRDRWSVESST